MGEAHKEGNGGGHWAAAGRDHEIGDLEISEGGGGWWVEERGQYPFERGKVQVQDRYHSILRQHKTSKGTPSYW